MASYDGARSSRSASVRIESSSRSIARFTVPAPSEAAYRASSGSAVNRWTAGSARAAVALRGDGVLRDHRCDRVFGDVTDDPVNCFPTFEENQARNAGDVILTRDGRILV